MEDTQKIFAIGARKIAEIKGWSQEYIAGRIKNGKQGTVSSWLRGRTKFPPERMPEFANLFQITEDDVLAVGREEAKQSIPQEDVTSIIDKAVNKRIDEIKAHKIKKNARHHEIVDQFKHPELMEEINHDLLELESLDLDEVLELRLNIKNKLEKLRKKKAGNNHQGNDQKNKTG